MTITQAKTPLRMVVHRIDRGMLRLALCSSSDMCTAQSAPMRGKIPEVIPARVLAPRLPQPPPSLNSVKTVFASSRGDRTQSVTTMPKKAKMCMTRMSDSRIGSFRARKTLKNAENAATAMVKSVPCHP